MELATLLPFVSLTWRPFVPTVSHSANRLPCSWSANSISASATADSNAGPSFQKPINDPAIDTRIHWGSSEEGWIGETEPYAGSATADDEEIVSSWRKSTILGLLINATDSHYRYLDLAPDAEPEEIKAAYRRLSKMYHPDTTSLPVALAAEKFVRLREAYTVLNSEEGRRLYDKLLAEQVTRQKDSISAQNSRVKESQPDSNPFKPKETNSEFYMDPVDRLGGENMGLSDQAQTAIVFDLFALVVSILCITYVAFVKNVPQ